MAGETSRSSLIFHIIFSIVGVLSGVIGIVVLALNKQIFTSDRYASLTFAGLSSVLGIWNLVLHTMYFQDIWRTWLKGLRLFITIGAIFSIISIISFLIFLIVATVQDREFSSNSFYITSIWCFWSFVWAAMLYYFSRRYRTEHADLTALLDF